MSAFVPRPNIGTYASPRRRIKPEQGRALEIIGHAIEYLADEYIKETGETGTLRASDPEVQAIQILMGLSRNVYYDNTEQRLANAEAMANATPTAIFVMKRDGSVQHWNTAAEALILSGDGLLLENNHLVATDMRAHEVMTRLFKTIAPTSLPHADFQISHSLALPRSAGKRPLQVAVKPLPKSYSQRSHADFLLLISDPATPSRVLDDALSTLYGFTQAETEIANGLLMGHSPREISSLRNVSVSTVRQQIKNMLSKTDTTRQPDMVRLFMTLPQVYASPGSTPKPFTKMIADRVVNISDWYRRYSQNRKKPLLLR